MLKISESPSVNFISEMLERKTMRKRLTNLFLLFLCIVSLSMFSTMIYMTGVCQTQMMSRRCDGPEVRKIQNCSKACQHRILKTTTDTPTFHYTNALNPENGTLSWKLLWPEKEKLEICKILPKLLIGRISMSPTVTADDVRNVRVLSKVKYGGVYRPPNCKSLQKVAVIIPYRDRLEHLDVLVNHLHNMLQRQQVHYGIYVVEMALPAQFNRGLLANAGFLTARSIGNYTCYVIHDVDLVPINDHNLYRCSTHGPIHLVTQNSAFKTGKIPYIYYVGGVIAMTTEQYTKINGFSNLYFGWGGEDDDLYKRMAARNMTLQRPPEHIGLFMALKHTQDSSNPPNPHRELLLSQAAYRIDIDGLSSIRYNRKSLEFRPLYTWILIDCVEREILERYPFLRADTELMARNPKKNKHLTVIRSGNGIVKEQKFAYIHVGKQIIN